MPFSQRSGSAALRSTYVCTSGCDRIRNRPSRMASVTTSATYSGSTMPSVPPSPSWRGAIAVLTPCGHSTDTPMPSSPWVMAIVSASLMHAAFVTL